MTDMKKKVGKAGLKGLLNRKEPEPEVTTRRAWDDPVYDDGYGGYGNGGYGRGSGFRSAARGPSPYDNLGQPVSSGSKGGYVNAIMEGEYAVISDKEARRVSIELNNILWQQLKQRGLIVKLDKGGVISDFLTQIIFDGTLKYVRGGGGFANIKRDTWFEEHLDDDEIEYDDLDKALPLDFGGNDDD